MFRTAELGRKLSKSEFNQQVPDLRIDLLEVQQKLRGADFPVIIVFGGVDAAGKSEAANALNEWMDPRWILTHAYGAPSDEVSERPEYWRFWRDLPPKGRIGLFMSAWYSRPIRGFAYEDISDADFEEALQRVVAFERALTDDGALILKFWMHLSREEQKKRYKALQKNPLTSWRVTETDWLNLKKYDRFIMAAERAIARTSTGEARWQIVEGLDTKYSNLSVAMAIRDALQKHLIERDYADKVERKLRRKRDPSTSSQVIDLRDHPKAGSHLLSNGLTVLSRLDMSRSLGKDKYAARLAKEQAKLNGLYRRAKEQGISTILVFEGWDAGGKGGAIRRIAHAVDSRDYQVIPIASPTDEEAAHHYLWRFWRHLSRAGRLTVFDRSWYGRILVERVEGFATEAEWQRAYAEINDFEQQLVSHGIVLVKYWMHVTKEEQLARFKDREEVAYKRWKLTEEDWRNREKWEQYEIAVNDMIERTSSAMSPWTLVEGNDKRYARVKVIKTLCDKLKAAVGQAEG